MLSRAEEHYNTLTFTPTPEQYAAGWRRVLAIPPQRAHRIMIGSTFDDDVFTMPFDSEPATFGVRKAGTTFNLYWNDHLFDEYMKVKPQRKSHAERLFKLALTDAPAYGAAVGRHSPSWKAYNVTLFKSNGNSQWNTDYYGSTEHAIAYSIMVCQIDPAELTAVEVKPYTEVWR
jgi:hypothetical protein